jgi:hypothetical protein
MGKHNKNNVRHDRGPTCRLTPNVPGIAPVLEWTSGLSSWFRSLWSEARRPGLHETTFWLLGTRRCQPIPVVVSTRQPAATRSRSRGHFARI